MDTTPQTIAPEGAKTTMASRKLAPLAHAMRGSELDRLKRGRKVSARILKLHTMLLTGAPSWKRLAREMGLRNGRPLSGMVLSYVAFIKRRPRPEWAAKTPQKHILAAAEAYVIREEEKRAKVANDIATPQKSVISPVSDAQASVITDPVPQYSFFESLSRRAGEAPAVPVDVSLMHKIANRDVPRKMLALFGNPDPQKFFIVRVPDDTMEPRYFVGEILLVLKTDTVIKPTLHVIYDEDVAHFNLVQAEPAGPGIVRIQRHLGDDRSVTTLPVNRLNIHGRVLCKIAPEVTDAWQDNNANTSEVAC